MLEPKGFCNQVSSYYRQIITSNSLGLAAYYTRGCIEKAVCWRLLLLVCKFQQQDYHLTLNLHPQLLQKNHHSFLLARDA